MTKIRNGFILLVLLVLAGGAYTILGGSVPDWDQRYPLRPVQVGPGEEGKVRVKIAVVFDGDSLHGTTLDLVRVWYHVDGTRYPGVKGNFTVKKYWWRVLALEKGQTIQLNATQGPRDKIADLFIYRLDAKGNEGRIMDHCSIIGKGTCEARATVS